MGIKKEGKTTTRTTTTTKAISMMKTTAKHQQRRQQNANDHANKDSDQDTDQINRRAIKSEKQPVKQINIIKALNPHIFFAIAIDLPLAREAKTISGASQAKAACRRPGAGSYAPGLGVSACEATRCFIAGLSSEGR